MEKVKKIVSKIRIYDKEYPAYQTMGAMLAFKANSGKDVSEMGGNDIALMVTFLYFVVRSACKREGVSFDFPTVEEFADGISMEDFTEWSMSIATPAVAQEPGNEADPPTQPGEESGEQK